MSAIYGADDFQPSNPSPSLMSAEFRTAVLYWYLITLQGDRSKVHRVNAPTFY